MGACFNTTAKNKQPTLNKPIHDNLIKKPTLKQTIKIQLLAEGNTFVMKKSIFQIGNIQHASFQQIGKDIERTYPNEKFYSAGQNRQKLRRLLQRYALYFPELGYTQGINFVGGFLLLKGMSQSDALKCLIQLNIHQDLLLIGLYEDFFPLVGLYCELFWLCLKDMMPKVQEILRRINIPDQMWIFQWFITVFIYSFPISYIDHVMEFVVKEKYFAMVRIALGVLKCLERQIMSYSENVQDEVMDCFQNLKDIQFCEKKAPIANIIANAQTIKKQFIMERLRQSSVNNWYKQYFLNESQRKQKYMQLMEMIEKNQKQFLIEKKSRSGSRSSMIILDSIELSKKERLRAKLSRSETVNNKLLAQGIIQNIGKRKWNSLMQVETSKDILMRELEKVQESEVEDYVESVLRKGDKDKSGKEGKE